MAKQNTPFKELSVAVAGLCDCCTDVEGSWKDVLQQFPEHLPVKGTPQGLRIIVRNAQSGAREAEIDDPITRHLLRVAAAGIGRIDDDGLVVLPGVLPLASSAGH